MKLTQVHTNTPKQKIKKHQGTKNNPPHTHTLKYIVHAGHLAEEIVLQGSTTLISFDCIDGIYVYRA